MFWTAFTSQFFSTVDIFQVLTLYEFFLWAYIPSFSKSIIFAWNKRHGFYFIHVKNHRTLGITNHQNEKLVTWILKPLQRNVCPGLFSHGFLFRWFLFFFLDICELPTSRICIFHVNKIKRRIFLKFKNENPRIHETTYPRISKNSKSTKIGHSEFKWYHSKCHSIAV